MESIDPASPAATLSQNRIWVTGHYAAVERNPAEIDGYSCSSVPDRPHRTCPRRRGPDHPLECPQTPGLGPQLARRLVLPDSFYSPSVASQRGSIRCVHEVRRGEKRCLSSLRLLTWR
jgi:hypothetical protein